MSNSPEDARGRWWEIHSEGQLNEGGHRELMIGNRGRSRPERSLSAGAELAEESRHPARALLWPVVSMVAALGVVLSVGYVVSTRKPTSSVNTPSAAPATRVIAPQGDVGVKQDAGVTPVVPSTRLGGLMTVGGSAPPALNAQAGIPRTPTAAGGQVGMPAPAAPVNIPAGSAGAPTGSAGAPAGPAGAPAGTFGGAEGDTGNQSTATATSGPPMSSQDPRITVEGPAPDAPGPRQDGKPKPGTGGCAPYNTKAYICTIAHEAPVYGAGTTKRYGPVPASSYLSLCQSKGSKYSVGNRANDWWAWIQVFRFWLWVPTVFLTGAPDNGPAPGLPVCDDNAPASTSNAPAVTKTPSTTSTRSAPTTTN